MSIQENNIIKMLHGYKSELQLTNYLEYNPSIMIDKFFDIVKTHRHEVISNLMDLIQSILKSVVDDHDVNTIDENTAFNICKILDTLCMVSQYNLVLVIPSYILIEHYKQALTSNNLLEIQQMNNCLRKIIDDNNFCYDLGVDGLNEIIKDLYTCGYFDVRPLNSQVVALDFDNMRTLTALMKGRVKSSPMVITSTDVSNISRISSSYSQIFYEYLQSGDELNYNQLCDKVESYGEELIGSVQDLLIRDYLSFIQSYFNHILFDILNPHECVSTYVESILSLFSSLCKETEYNPFIVANRLFLSNIITIINTKKWYGNFTEVIVKFNKYSLSIHKGGHGTCCTTRNMYEDLPLILNNILQNNCCRDDILYRLTEELSFNTNYFKQLLNSEISKLSESTLPTHCPSWAPINTIDVSVSTLTEGFNILSNGNIQMIFDRESSLIDEYNNNHRLLKYNHELENYEAMKYNLVYLLLLIETIESQIIYNSRTSDTEKSEAKKVIRLCKGDLGVYLPIIKKMDSSFDLNKFYKKVKDEKNTVEINTVQTISGIKMIIKTIL